MTYDQCAQFLYHLRGLTRPLDRVFALCAEMGNPQKNLRCIHIAGTNGKGSTSATLASILKKAGYRVGLYTSPHLVELRERIQINGEMISKEKFVAGVEKIQAAMARLLARGITPSFFEATTVLAFDYFAQEQIDLIVLETGMGGRWDATNVIDPLCSVITSISMDHEKFLGRSLEEIAFEKAGIIKHGRPVLAALATAEVAEVLYKKAAVEATAVDFVEPAREVQKEPSAGKEALMQFFEIDGAVFETPLLGSHQLQNVALAIATAQELRNQGFKISQEAVLEGVAQTRWPGRFQVLSRNPWFVLDGGHNIDGLNSALKTWQQIVGHPPGRIIFGVMRDKQLESMIEQIDAQQAQVWLVPVASERSALPQDLQSFFLDSITQVWPSVHEALQANQMEPHPQGTYVMGSLYLVGEVLSLLQNISHELNLNG